MSAHLSLSQHQMSSESSTTGPGLVPAAAATKAPEAPPRSQSLPTVGVRIVLEPSYIHFSRLNLIEKVC